MSSRRLTFAVLAIASLLCTACGAPSAAELARKPSTQLAELKITDDVREVARSGNQFAFDLYGRLGKEPGNLFFSPASISTALAMVYIGARGDTEAQMARVLHFELPNERLVAGFAAFSQALNSGDKTYRLTMANRLWGQQSYAFQPQFLQITREQFGAELAPLDFARSEQARETINRWIEEQTNDKITDLIAPGVLNAATRLVLTNAIYFKGAWEHEFWENATEEAPFHVTSEKDVQAPLMHQVGDFSYAETDDAQLVVLAYAGGDLSLVVLLPKEVDGLEKLEAALTAENVDQWSSLARDRKVQLWLPKFKTTSEFSLAEALESLGMTLLFNDAADLSGIASGGELRLSAVIHKSYIDVNEAGTEAAAATAVTVKAAAKPGEPEEPVIVRADHPFAYLIRDNRSGAILFLGRLLEPGK